MCLSLSTDFVGTVLSWVDCLPFTGWLSRWLCCCCSAIVCLSVMRSLGQGVVEFKKGLQGIEDEMHNSTNKIEEQPSKPQAKEEAKVSEAEPAQR